MSVNRKLPGCTNPYCGGGKWCTYCAPKEAPEPPREEKSRLDGKLEPEAEDGCSSLTEAATLSLAISMKRIADVLEGGNPERMTIFELIADRMPSS